jgi:hypothetical protein
VICGLLLFNGGIIYSQFNEIKTNTAATADLTRSVVAQIAQVNGRVDLISQRVTAGEARMTANDQRQTEEEGRLRQVEITLGGVRTRERINNQSFSQPSLPQQSVVRANPESQVRFRDGR